MISLTSPVRTRAHGWPAGVKLAALCVVSTGLFLTPRLGVQLVALALVLVLYAMPGPLFLRAGLRSLRMVLPFVIVLLVWHALIGELRSGVLVVLRMVVLVALANLLTMTTALEDLVSLMSRLLAPLRRLGLSTRPLELAIPLVLRFTPVLVARGGMLVEAWRARSRRRPGWRLVLPMMLLALDDADHVGEALRARGSVLPPLDHDQAGDMHGT